VQYNIVLGNICHWTVLNLKSSNLTIILQMLSDIQMSKIANIFSIYPSLDVLMSGKF